MPGMIMTAACPCGFRRRRLRVGVDDFMGRNVIWVCYKCRKMFSDRVDPEHRGKKLQCHDCWEEFADLADPANWVPEELGRKYPDTDPWLLTTGGGGRDPEDSKLAERIRFRCPKCGEFRMTVASCGEWD